MYDRSFINPEIRQYWDAACRFDKTSAGCGFFTTEFQKDIDEINPFSVYGYCYYNDSFGQERKVRTQESILLGIKSQFEAEEGLPY